MSRPSEPPSQPGRLQKIEADLEELKRLTRGLRPHRIRDHTDVIVQGATAGSTLAYGGEPAGGKWGPGSAAAGGPLVAYFLNDDGARVSSRQKYRQVYAGEDRSWFEFPMGGTDDTRIKMLSPGIYVAVFHGSSPTNFTVEVVGGSGSEIAHGSASLSAHSVCGSVALDPSVFTTTQDFYVETFGTNPIYGQLAILHWPAPLWFQGVGGGWVWEDTAGWT